MPSSSPDRPTHRPLQQTFTWRQGRGAKYWYRERSHVRFVVAEVGRSVTHFRNTKELVMAFRDAIIGHRIAMTKGGILHRDISVGNILIVDNPASHDRCCGFIHDFDYSSMSRVAPEDDVSSLSAAELDSLLLADDFHDFLKERTGTFLFMASELLTPSADPIIHAIPHDLESFYWVLLWVVLRHTQHVVTNMKGKSRHQTCAEVFQQGDAIEASKSKTFWLKVYAKNLEVTRNQPLTALLKRFAVLINDDNMVPDYDEVLQLFNTALASESWPDAKRDGPLQYIPPDMRTVNEFSSEDSAYRRQRHARKRARALAGKGKGRATTPEESDDDPEEDYDEPWESDDEDSDEIHPAAEADDVETTGNDDNQSVHYETFNPSDYPGFDEEDWQDAVDVSTILRFDAEEEDLDIDPATLRSLRDMHLAPAPWEAGPSSVAQNQSGESRSSKPRVQRGVAAAAEGDVEPRQHPRTRAQTTRASAVAANPPEMVGGGRITRSGPQTRSITRAGNSGKTARRSEGSGRGSRGSRKAR
uniref:Fungal-type protein kinase domain-containing protein n=1 Tax=Ganoderma boninense TaxID=34458 RepID=A0A5K1JXE3_9APHY|nr:Uncharacterized protein [Ganoderma boninense]